MPDARAVLVFLGVALPASLAPQLAHADWPADGRALCAAPNLQGGARITSDGADGAIVVWHDRRTFAFNIDAQHVLASGEVDPAWPVNGRALLTDSLSQAITILGVEFPQIVSDGAGGAIIVWPDARSSVNGLDIYAHHVLASGALDPVWPVNGAVVCSATGEQNVPVLASDGAGGAVVAWQDNRLGATVNDIDIYAQHLTATGTVDPAWPANGVALSTQPKAQVSPTILADGAGGAIVAWSDLRSGNPGIDIYAMHVSGAGVVDPAWPANGAPLCTAPGTQDAQRIISDGTGGAIVAWTDLRDGTNDVYAQRVLISGAIAPGWPANGRAISATAFDEGGVSLVADGAGGAIITWGDTRITGFHDIRAQHLLSSSALDPAWPADGRALSATPSEETFESTASDGAGGAIVAWQVGFNIVAQHVLGSGALDPTFSPNGRPLSDLPNLQQNPVIVEAGAAGPIVAWMDERDGFDFDIYALRVFNAGTVDAGGPPVARDITFASPFPSPAAGPVTLRFALPRAAGVSLTIYNVAGRRVRDLAAGDRPAGEQSSVWDLRDDAGRTVQPGVYFARLAAGDQVLTRKIPKPQ